MNSDTELIEEMLVLHCLEIFIYLLFRVNLFRLDDNWNFIS